LLTFLSLSLPTGTEIDPVPPAEQDVHVDAISTPYNTNGRRPADRRVRVGVMTSPSALEDEALTQGGRD
jgi:hypothetical protein